MKTIAVIVAILLLSCTAKTVKVQVAVSTPKAHPILLPPKPREASAPLPMENAAGFISFANIYFDYDKADLRPDALDQLGKIGSTLTIRPETLCIYGHCDERGSNDYNMALGLRRAQAARDWLTAFGISGNRILVSSFGKEHPAVEGCADDPCHQKNRRCEFTVKGE